MEFFYVQGVCYTPYNFLIITVTLLLLSLLFLIYKYYGISYMINIILLAATWDL